MHESSQESVDESIKESIDESIAFRSLLISRLNAGVFSGVD